MPDPSAPAGDEGAAPVEDPRPRALGGAPWPGTDAAEAHRVVLGLLGADHWPVLPELPDSGPGADAAGRSAALLAEVGVDLQPHGWRVSPPGRVASGMDRRRAASWWREDAQRWADTAGAEGMDTPRLAVRVRGPLTLLGELWLPGGERVLVDAGARRDLAEAYREGMAAALADLRRTTGAARIGVLLDEPRASAVLAGELATASGYRTVRSMPRDEARATWRAALASLAGVGVDDVWLDPHAVDARVADLALLASESVPRTGDDDVAPSVSLVLDVGRLDVGRLDADPQDAAARATPAAWEVAAGRVDAGRGVTLRGVPGDAPTPARLMETWDRLGLDPAHARRLTLTAPGPHTPAVLGGLRRDAEELGSRIDDVHP